MITPNALSAERYQPDRGEESEGAKKNALG